MVPSGVCLPKYIYRLAKEATRFMGTQRDRILMCPPDYFTVDYVINPWMAGQDDSLNLDRAKDQWAELRDRIGEYADIETMEPQPNLPDMEVGSNLSCRAAALALMQGACRPRRFGKRIIAGS